MAELDLILVNKTLTSNTKKVLIALETAENIVIRNIGREYKKLFNKLDNELNKLYKKLGKGKVSWAEVQKFNRLDKLVDRMKDDLNIFYKELNKQLNSVVLSTVKSAFYGYSWALNNAIDMRLAFDLTNKEALKLVKSSPFYQLSKNKLYTDSLDRIRGSLYSSFMQGKSYHNTAGELKKILNIKYNKASQIVRTEMHRVSELAHNEEFLQSLNMGIDTRLKLLATIDKRTRQQSLEVDGKLSNDKGRFKYPDGNWYIPGSTGRAAWDINDRERSIQIVDGVNPKTRYVRGRGQVPFSDKKFNVSV